MSEPQPLHSPAAVASPKTAIKIGGVQYNLDICKIPYLKSFVSFQTKVEPGSTEFVHGPIPLFDVALKGIESGHRQCFRSLPVELAQYHTLCETYEFLCVDILDKQSIDEIFRDLKFGKTDYEENIRGNKSKARDSAFKLLYLILLGEFDDEIKISTKIFNAVLYVVSHSGTFKWKTRNGIRAAYEERFVISEKQKAGLNKWEKSDAARLAAEEDGDMTTVEEDSDRYYDSDDW